MILQSFPPDWPFQGSRSAVFQQVGNAVPPLLAERVLLAVLSKRR
jgi:DNA (cytosine-5)-methyltransferase 1